MLDAVLAGERLRRSIRTLARVRWVATLFAAVQVATYYLPFPPGVLAWSVALVGLLGLGNLLLWLASRRDLDLPTARRLAVASLVLDTTVVVGLITTYTFDPDTASFALIYVLPLEGAVLFQLRGAVATMAAAAVAYIAREAYGALVFDLPFLPQSISFRMGLGFLIAAVAGVMARDLSAEREEALSAKAELERSTDELRTAHAQLLAATQVQDDFLAMTNHELRTPLTAIVGYASILQRRWDALDSDARLDAVTRIRVQAERLNALVEDLLTISAAQARGLHVTPIPVSLEPLLCEAIAGFDEAEVVGPVDVVARADPVRLLQVVINLLSNARKYGAPPVRVAVRDDGEHVVLTVTDAGDGVPPEFVPLLFDRFSQASVGTSRSAEGSGLGLAIVALLVEAQDGTVWYEPAEPTGSRFCVRLPRAEVASG